MNYRYFSLKQSTTKVIRKSPLTYRLEPEGAVQSPKPVALGVYAKHSHSGTRMGIMRSTKKDDTHTPIVQDIMKCLTVNSADEYQTRANELDALTKHEQAGNDRFCMLVFNVRDDQGERIGQNDYDLFLLAGNSYQPHQLPEGFFIDKQMNELTGRLVYYLDADKMKGIKNGKFGLRIVARPTKGFSYYCAAEFQSDGIAAHSILAPNETTYVDITLHRFVNENVFRFDPAKNGPRNFKKIKPSGKLITNK